MGWINTEMFGPELEVSLPRESAGSTKNYSRLYGRFLDEVVLPSRVLETAYHSDLAQHFYTDVERAEFRSNSPDPETEPES